MINRMGFTNTLAEASQKILNWANTNLVTFKVFKSIDIDTTKISLKLGIPLKFAPTYEESSSYNFNLL